MAENNTSSDTSPDVVDWSPEPVSAEELERQRVITRALGECDRQRLAGRDRLANVNVRLARAGQLPADEVEVAAVAYQRSVEGESLPARLARSGQARPEPWEVGAGPPVEPERPDPLEERDRLVATVIHRHWNWWASIGKPYPLQASAPAAEHEMAGHDFRELLVAVNHELVGADLDPIGADDLVAAMARAGRAMVPHPLARAANGRFSRRGRIARGSRS
jgi:hypothetical protein